MFYLFKMLHLWASTYVGLPTSSVGLSISQNSPRLLTTLLSKPPLGNKMIYGQVICFVTARIRRMGEGNVFARVCVSVHTPCRAGYVHSRRYASCGLAGWLSCFFFSTSSLFTTSRMIWFYKMTKHKIRTNFKNYQNLYCTVQIFLRWLIFVRVSTCHDIIFIDG